MKKSALVLCATLWLLGVGAVTTAQGAMSPAGAAAPAAGQVAGEGAAGGLGNAQAVDETALAIGTQAGGQAQSGDMGAGTSTLAYFLRMVLVLAIVLAAIWLVFRLLRKAQKPTAQDNSMLRVLASASLGQGRSVHVVGLGGKAWLVGAAESSVGLIAEIEEREVIDELELRSHVEEGKPKGDFQSILGNILGRGLRQKAKGKAGGADFRADFLAEQRDRLKKY